MAAPRTVRLRGYPAIQEYLRAHGAAFHLDRHQLYRLSQRQEHPLPIDGPVGMPVAVPEDLDAWVTGERQRRNRALTTPQLRLFRGDD